MDIKQIKSLVKLVESSAINELEVSEEGFQIRITKSASPDHAVIASVPQTQVVQSAPPPPTTYETSVQEAKVVPTEGAHPDNVVEICAPMVGTFYRSPSPDAESYVEVGAAINPGKILCIIEAMKLMNEIEAEISGKIVKILVENAQPVEYNQPLFLVEKS
jgi:acetyl-CoA carboxylase biotin carboxyl carrier protein